MPAETGADPHLGLDVLAAGEPLDRASGAVVLLHGRGASPEDILFSCRSLALPGFALLAPRAQGGTWYPNRFTEPLASNEPWLSSALRAVGGLLGRVEARLPAARTVLLGFSQGACLALEFAARHPRRYGAVVGLSGGLIGPDGTVRAASGSLAGTPVLLLCSDHDPHIEARRVEEAADFLDSLGGEVTMRLYSDIDHEVTEDELALVGELMQGLADRDPAGHTLGES